MLACLLGTDLKNILDREKYIISKANDGLDNIIFNTNKRRTNPLKKYKFHKIFDQDSHQSDIFEDVAKPVIDRVIGGFNGTIFAYGQTGSGKTYTITGSPKNYNDRGIIPRSLQYIFALNEKESLKPMIYISYMEIYNENGYDLLCTKQGKLTKGLEALPKIALLENKKGEAHIRNLTVQPVNTEQEAMRLLFLGDTNRTIAETPMNEYSSRSHCIFTIYFTLRDAVSENMRFSKLHLVDLAGSERVSKTMTTGTALGEAKYINLSLHFLQQVITALTESKRVHIPYRNSMMTYILRDSLCGNCLTTMLATLAVTKNNIGETISTCSFAQKVSLLTTEPIINEIVDPSEEIMFLRTRIEELEKRIQILTSFKTGGNLTEDVKEMCKSQIKNYLKSDAPNELKLEPNLSQIQFCFSVMKNEFEEHKRSFHDHMEECAKSKDHLILLENTVDKKEQEINSLKNILDNIPENPVNPKHANSTETVKNVNSGVGTTKSNSIDIVQSDSHDDIQELYEHFLKQDDIAPSVNIYKSALEKKLVMARICSEAINQCQENILFLKRQLESYQNGNSRFILINDLEEQQNKYKRALAELKDIQSETSHLQAGLEQTELRTRQKFEAWLKQQQISYGSMQNVCCSGTRSTQQEFDMEHHLKPKVTFGEMQTKGIKSCWQYNDFRYKDIETNNVCETDSLDVFQNYKPDKLIDTGSFSSIGTRCPTSTLCNEPCYRNQVAVQNLLDTCVQCNLDANNYCADTIINCDVCAISKDQSPQCHYLDVNNRCCCIQQSNKRLDVASNDFIESNETQTSTISKDIGVYYIPDYKKYFTVEDTNYRPGDTVFLKPHNENQYLKTRLNDSISSVEIDLTHYVKNNKCNLCEKCVHPSFIQNCDSSKKLYSDDSRTNTLPNSSKISLFSSHTEKKGWSDGALDYSRCTSETQNEMHRKYTKSEIVDDIEEERRCGNVDMNKITSDCLFREDDSSEFKEFIKSVPLTGEPEIDEEVVNFYRVKFY